MAEKNTKNFDTDLMHSLYAVLADNDRGTHTIPAEGVYPHQWLWDSCFIAIGLRHIDPARAQQELKSLLRGQWSNGMLPNMIFDSGIFYRSDRELWRSDISYNAPADFSTSGITQPPMLAEAVLAVGQKLSRAERLLWYRSMFRPLIKYHKWLYRERDPEKSGLVLNIHPWETGMDDTPPWMSVIKTIHLPFWVKLVGWLRIDKLINVLRRDTKFITATQRPSTLDALALFSMMQRIRRLQYDTDKVLKKKLLAVEDVEFNSIFNKANNCLAKIAKELKQDLPEDLTKNMARSKEALDLLWNEKSKAYHSRDHYTKNFLDGSSLASLMPLYSESISDERASILVREFKDKSKYNLSFPVPSVPKNSKNFRALRFWQGPTWVNTNWLIIEGLEGYGYQKEADRLRHQTIELVKKSGPYEYFSATSGRAGGAKNFSWTAALAIDIMNK